MSKPMRSILSMRRVRLTKMRRLCAGSIPCVVRPSAESRRSASAGVDSSGATGVRTEGRGSAGGASGEDMGTIDYRLEVHAGVEQDPPVEDEPRLAEEEGRADRLGAEVPALVEH